MSGNKFNLDYIKNNIYRYVTKNKIKSHSFIFGEFSNNKLLYMISPLSKKAEQSSYISESQIDNVFLRMDDVEKNDLIPIFYIGDLPIVTTHSYVNEHNKFKGHFVINDREIMFFKK